MYVYIPQRAALLMSGGTGMSSSDLFMLLREENDKRKRKPHPKTK